MAPEKTFVLVQVIGNKATPIKTGNVKLIQSLRTQLKAQPQYRSCKLQVRTEEGFKRVPILTPKTKKQC